jgi:hypothetical protein
MFLERRTMHVREEQRGATSSGEEFGNFEETWNHSLGLLQLLRQVRKHRELSPAVPQQRSTAWSRSWKESAFNEKKKA